MVTGGQWGEGTEMAVMGLVGCERAGVAAVVSVVRTWNLERFSCKAGDRPPQVTSWPLPLLSKYCMKAQAEKAMPDRREEKRVLRTAPWCPKPDISLAVQGSLVPGKNTDLTQEQVPR